jgi:HK97 family phage major capsid protein
VPVLQVACERGEEAAFYAASITTNANKTAARETANASKVVFSDLSALLFDLGAYSVGRCAYLVSTSMLAAMHSMTDDNGYPINKLTKDGSGQFYWDGVPVFPTTALEAIADGKYVAAAINVDACRIAASQPWVNRYDQNSARPNQTGFDYLQYAAFGIKSGAVKLLKVKSA